jgi:hypothetical protein
VVFAFDDRSAYLDYTAGKWQFRVGRQRINWGVNLVWNPNDVFNSFSYFDFDYEERPGSDAVRVQYYTGTTSSASWFTKQATMPTRLPWPDCTVFRVGVTIFSS